MMTEEEGLITYELEAIEHVLEKGILWKQFREAIRIMQFIPDDHALFFTRPLWKSASVDRVSMGK